MPCPGPGAGVGVGGWAADEQADSHDEPPEHFAVLRQDPPSAGSGLTALPHQGPAPQQVSLETRDK